MDNGIESLSSTIMSVNSNTQLLNSRVGTYYSDFLTNFNFVSNNLDILNQNIEKLNNAFNKISSLDNDGFKNFMSDKILSIDDSFKNMTTGSIVPIMDDSINNKIYMNVYDSSGSLVVDKYPLVFSNRVNSMYNFPINPESLGLDDGIYSCSVFYEDAQNIFEFDGEIDVINNVLSNDGLLERFILDNEVNKIATNLRNYKIYLIDKNTNSIVNKEPVLRSTIDGTTLDIVFFSIRPNSNIDYSNYNIVLKEELFDTVNFELVVGEYDTSDVGNILFGNAERDLDSGVFIVYDGNGNEIGRTVSTRFGKKEIRRKL